MRVAVLSDLHLGTRTRIDLARCDAVRSRIAAFVRGFDEVVLLGDALELRDRPLAHAVAAAEPLLAEVGAALGNGRVVLVPGNHDHALLRDLPVPSGVRAAEALRSGGLVAEVPPGARGAAGAVRDRLGTPLVVAYPGWRPAPHVWATHGHYVDAHSAAPTLECALSAVAGLVAARPRGRPWQPADYEARLAPAYGLYYAIAQRPALHGLADAGKTLVRRAETRLGVRGAGGGDRRAGGVRLPGDRFGTAPGELRRPGLLPLARVLEHLRVEADHVLFGHTHRTGPLDGDDPALWRGPGGAALWNTGSWVDEPDYTGALGSRSPYWPGTVVTVEGTGVPQIHRLLAEGSDVSSAATAYGMDRRASSPRRDVDRRSHCRASVAS